MLEEPTRYRAFLSYSHADSCMAKRVHARLEGFRIDKELIGRETPYGPVPAALHPIFRDRNDFSAGGALAEQTRAALDASAALIVLASPHAARSRYVNEEVQLFRRCYPTRPVIPLIAAGRPDDVEDECFPPALRFEFAADGTMTDTPANVLAADLREQGDGLELALAKVVARLIGLPPDDIYRRAERERRRRGRLQAATAACVAALVVCAGILLWQSHAQKATLAEIDALVQKYSLVRPDKGGTRQSLTQAFTAIAEGAAADPRYAKALGLLRHGKAAEAEPLLKAVAEDKARRAEGDARDAAAAYRNLASIAAVSDPNRARGYYAQAARLDPSDVEGLRWHGEFQKSAGNLGVAEAAFAKVIELGKVGGHDVEMCRAQLGLGDIQRERGHLAAALAAYREALSGAERVARADPGDVGGQRGLAASYQRIGILLTAQGKLPEATASFRSSLGIAERRVASHPADAGRRRELAVSLLEYGGVLLETGHLAEALASYRSALGIAEQLARSDPGNVTWQRDLSISNDNVGDVLVVQGDLREAMRSYEASLAIRKRLATADPDNDDGQHDVSVSDDKIGSVLVAQGKFAEALKSYQAGLVIVLRLAKSEPGHARWERAMSVSFDRIGNVLMAAGQLPDALKARRASLDVRAKLAALDPSNVGWQRDLAVSYGLLGDVLAAQANVAEAMKASEAEMAITRRLAASDPGNANWQRDLSVSHERIGKLLLAQNHLPEALKAVEAALSIAKRLAASDPGNAGWQHDLSLSYGKLASLHRKMGNEPEARKSLDAGRTIVVGLTDRHPEWAEWKQDLAWFDAQIGEKPK